eukprot:EG_transcript_11415
MACFFAWRSPCLRLLWRQGLRSYATGTHEELFNLVADFVHHHKAMHEELMSRVAILEKTVSRLEQLTPDNFVGRPQNSCEMMTTERIKRRIAAEEEPAAPGGPAALGEGQSLLPHPEALNGDHYQAPVQDLLQFSGSDVKLRVKLMGPHWRRTKSDTMHCSQPGGLLFQITPAGDADGSFQDLIRISLSPEECAQVLLMDPDVGVFFERDAKAWNLTPGLVKKAMKWSPAREGCGMHLSSVQTEMALGKVKTLSILLQWPQVQLLQLIVEQAIPLMLGFAWPAGHYSPSWRGNYTIFQQKGALRVSFAPPIQRGGGVPLKGVLMLNIASREPADPAALSHAAWKPKDWSQAATVVLQDADCARLASLLPARGFSVVHGTPSGGSVQANFEAEDGGGVLVTVSGPHGEHQLSLTGPELKVIQVVARTLLPLMIGLTQL